MRENLIAVFKKKNAELNLSAIRDEEGIQIKHIEDSLQLLSLDIIQPKMWVADVGTWGGFPLLPLALSCPRTHFIGIDSVRKKVNALNDMIKELNIQNVQGVWSRIEEYQSHHFDVITARAVAYSDKLVKRAYPLLKKWGCFLLMKQAIPHEKQDIIHICNHYQMKIEKIHYYRLFEGDIERVIYVIRK